MEISERGIELIKSFEGCRLTAYKALPSETYWTIGWGHYSADVHEGDTITQQEADEMLRVDLIKYEDKVREYQDVYNFNQNQFDALVSFAYNVGSIRQLTVNGSRSIREIAEMIPAYCKANGKTVKGLVRRREEEKRLFLEQCQDGRNLKTEEVAMDVLDGKYGNGEQRMEMLEAEGYNYDEVQRFVNFGIKVKAKYGRCG